MIIKLATWVTALTVIAALAMPGHVAAQQRQHATPGLTTGAQVDAYLTQESFHGYIYLERQGQVILSKGYGMADTEHKIASTLQTKWPAFAESRFLVGLAIMRLQDQGKLTVHDHVCRYVTGCPTAWQPLTIEELLLNTSGIGSYDPFNAAGGLTQTMAACKATPLVSTTGTAGPWSDCNTLLLDTVIERVTGKTWATAMQDLVFGPAGMVSSGRLTNALRPPQRGRLYRSGFPTPELNYDGFNLAYTTVTDLIRLNHALLAGTLISKQARKAMFTPRMHDDPNDPNSPWRGYEVVTAPDMPTQYQVVCSACINGGGEDDEGLHAGFFMTIEVSPAVGAIRILLDDDTGYFNDDNTFFSLISKRLYGKTPAVAPALSGHARVTRLSSGAQIDAYLRTADFSGYVLLERHGQIILSKGYGAADKAANLPNTVQSRWPLFGPNRFVTAVAILRLQDKHKLTVHDRICTYVGGCPAAWRPLTIEELLLETSGLGSLDTSTSPGGVAEAVARCKALPLTATPGTITPGSRCNNLLLNAIVATVMGESWARAMQHLIYDPAHMTHSGQLTNALQPPARVQGYSAGVPIQMGNYNNYPVPVVSVEDLARLDRALLAGHLLSPQALAALFAPHLRGVAVLQRYVGFGGSHARQLVGGYECYVHPGTSTMVKVADSPGDVWGFTIDNAISPEDGSIAIIARNDDSSAGTAPTDMLFGLAAGLLWGK